jgi:hypothetical protein
MADCVPLDGSAVHLHHHLQRMAAYSWQARVPCHKILVRSNSMLFFAVLVIFALIHSKTLNIVTTTNTTPPPNISAGRSFTTAAFVCVLSARSCALPSLLFAPWGVSCLLLLIWLVASSTQ